MIGTFGQIQLKIVVLNHLNDVPFHHRKEHFPDHSNRLKILKASPLRDHNLSTIQVSHSTSLF